MQLEVQGRAKPAIPVRHGLTGTTWQVHVSQSLTAVKHVASSYGKNTCVKHVASSYGQNTCVKHEASSQYLPVTHRRETRNTRERLGVTTETADKKGAEDLVMGRGGG